MNVLRVQIKVLKRPHLGSLFIEIERANTFVICRGIHFLSEYI